MATSINYPTGLPCPMDATNSFKGGRTFLRSTFDYGTRTRADVSEDYLLSFTFTAPSRAVMKDFKDFYYTTLGKGVKSFNASWEVEGVESTKEFRFAERYSAKSVGGGQYAITGAFEMLTAIEDL